MPLPHLSSQLKVAVGQTSVAGTKNNNEDAIGVRIPTGALLTNKGIVAVIADGVSAAEAGEEASHTSVSSFISDYYSTHDSWSVKTSGVKVLSALNRWLYGRGQQYPDAEKGYVTTFSALILKSSSAYIFHVGDSRIYQFRQGQLEQLTRDHSTSVGSGQRFLARALGIDPRVEIDFHQIDLQIGDQFLLTTDGIHDWMQTKEIKQILLDEADADRCCQQLRDNALNAGSDDNLSAQLISIIETGSLEKNDALSQLNELPFLPPLKPGLIVDDWKVIKELHATSRSEVYLVESMLDGTRAALKSPSANFHDDPAYIERFILEEWIGTRVQSPNIVKVLRPQKRRFLYYLSEYIEGPTLANLLTERTRLAVADARNIVIQVASGLRALHRKDTLHQDIKPDNIIYTDAGVKIVDFGSSYIAGVSEINTEIQREEILGTAQYCAPEYRLGMNISSKSDQFSLGVLAYELLTGQHPYGSAYEKASTRKAFLKLTYRPAYIANPLVPVWMDGALKRTLSIAADDRYDSISEFVFDLQKPNPKYTNSISLPLIDRDPVTFWRSLSGLLALICLYLLFLALS